MATHCPVATPAQPNVSTNLPLEYQECFALLKQLSFKKGDFILASGKKANYYMDCRTTTLSGRGSYLLGKLLYEQIAPLNADAVGGVVIGAAPMVTAVTAHSAQSGHPLDGFLIRKESKGHGTGKQIEGHIQPWMRVVLVEDVVTTGGSLIKGIEAIERDFPSVTIAGVISIVDRNAGGREALAQKAIPYQSLYAIDAFLAE